MQRILDKASRPVVLTLCAEGRHHHIYRVLGAHPHAVDEIEGVLFSVYAPNARRVSLVGPFNDWDGRFHPMRRHVDKGIWELFVPDVLEGNYRLPRELLPEELDQLPEEQREEVLARVRHRQAVGRELSVAAQGVTRRRGPATPAPRC